MDQGPAERPEATAGRPGGADPAPRAVRADARRNTQAVLAAAKDVFTTSGVDAPIREIAARAGVGTATIYRHFPQRSDLVSAVFRGEVDACADAARALAAEQQPGRALEMWLARYADFIATKQGLAAALHSGDPAFEALPSYFDRRFRPVLTALLADAVAADHIRTDVDADDLLRAVANLCHTTRRDRAGHPARMIALLVDGLRYGAHPGETRPDLGRSELPPSDSDHQT